MLHPRPALTRSGGGRRSCKRRKLGLADGDPAVEAFGNSYDESLGMRRMGGAARGVSPHFPNSYTGPWLARLIEAAGMVAYHLPFPRDHTRPRDR